MKYIKLLFITFITGCVLGLALIVGIYFYIKPDLPSVDVLKDVQLQTPMRIYTRDGKLISQYGVKRRLPLTLEQIPLALQEAVIATEDSRFYDHLGIDPIGIVRAAVNLIMTGEKQQGASTLTMQMARDFFLTREKTFIRKIREVFIAWHMEQLLSKQEILELYLNKVALGHRSFGVGAAAQVYYGKAVDELSLAEVATIAGLPQAPSVLNPISRPDRSVERRRIVLLRMLDEGYISRSEFDEANSAAVTATKHGAKIELNAPYLADVIYNEMIEIYGKEESETGGYHVYASASSATQKAAQDAVVRNIHDYDERHGYRGPIGQLWVPPEPEQSIELESDANNDITPGRIGTNNQGVGGIADSVDAEARLPVTDDVIVNTLDEISVISSLIPAVVAYVNEFEIDVLYLDQADNITTQTINWDGLSWARAYVSDTKQGPDPETAADVVSAGSIIWIRKQDGAWRLSQIPNVSGALVAIDPFDGAVQAVVGGFSFAQSQFNRVTQAKRQVGSNIKPFIYSGALANGYTLASVINDAPINQWDASTGVAWRPQNSPPEYDGPVRMRYALGRSKNVVSVRLLRGMGLDRAVNYLTRFGFERDEIPRDETVSLGSGSHTPLEVARGFATFANGGFLIQPYFTAEIKNDQGEVLWQANPVIACDPCESESLPSTEQPTTEADLEALLAAEFNQITTAVPENQQPDKSILISAEQVISEHNAFLTADMMRTAVRTNGSWTNKTYWMGTGWRARNILQRTDIGGKTGTTNDSRDTWFSGFAPGLVATSWLGFDDMSRQLGRTTRNQNLINLNPDKFNWIGNALIGAEDGAKGAQPAWIRFMQVVLDGVEEQPMTTPDGLMRVRIDRTTGLLTHRTDHTSMFEYFMPDTMPTQYVIDDEVIDPATVLDSPAEPEEIF